MNSFQLLTIKIHIDAYPFGTISQWITPSKFHQTHNITVEPNRFLNDDFDKLAGTGPLFLEVRVVIDLLLITCDNSPDESIINGITDKLTTDIHFTLSLLRCQFMRYRSIASVWFFKWLNLAMYGIFWCTKFFWQHTSTFSSKTLRIFTISHNLGRTEHGKSLVFSSPV